MSQKDESKKANNKRKKHNQAGPVGKQEFAVPRNVNQGTGNSASSARTVVSSAAGAPALITSLSQPSVKTVRGFGGSARTLKKWCFDYTPVYFSPNELKPSDHLNRGAIVELTGNKQTFSTGIETPWSEIVFKKYDARMGIKWVTGWVKDASLDDYHEKFPEAVVPISNPTPYPLDAQQYMLLEGTARYNLCGEFCAAFIVNDEIDSVLAAWRRKDAISYNQILANGKDKKTSETDLKNILRAVLGEYGYGQGEDQIIFFRERLTLPISSSDSFLEDLKRMLPTHSLIVGVMIDNAGELIGKNEKGIKHWIVLDRITRNGNRVEIYNSFPNKRQEYSFTEFFNSVNTDWSGVWVKRKRARPTERTEILPRLEVAIANPNPRYTAKQYLDVEGRRHTNLCGEFCIAFIVQEAIDNVLAHWKEVQPFLYDDIIRNNKPTNILNLLTILKAHGYNTPGDFTFFSHLTSPGRLAKMLETHYFLAGVGIDDHTGKLKRGSTTRHWVVVEKFTPLGKNRGWVELYNPFMNCWEEYSFKELLESAGILSGLWVKRIIIPNFVPQIIEMENVSDEPQKVGRFGQVTDYELRMMILRKIQGQKLTRIPNKIIAELVEKSGWKSRDITNKINEILKGRKFGERSESEFLEGIAQQLKRGNPLNKVAAELAGRKMGWKKQEVINVFKKAVKTGKIEKWTEPELRCLIELKLGNVKSAEKILTELVDITRWKRREISKVLETMIEADPGKLKSKAATRTSLAAEPVWKFTVDPQTTVHASKLLAEFIKWQDSLLAVPGSQLYRVRRWGDSVMGKQRFSVNIVGTTNFQAVKLWSPEGGWGGVTNYLRIPHEHVRNLAAMQIEDMFDAKETSHNKAFDMEQWLVQKMSWLCKDGGTIYTRAESWKTASQIRWGTIALGGNLVAIDGTETFTHKLPGEATKRSVVMARVKGFRKSDWNRPLDDLLAEGLVHRCFCAYWGNVFGDTPKGIVYSPFYSPLDWDFPGQNKPKAFYLPLEWLEPKGS